MLYTFYIFWPKLITTTRNSAKCSSNYIIQKYGIIIFSINNPSTHSVFGDSDLMIIIACVLVVVMTYIIDIYRLVAYNTRITGSQEFKWIFACWALTAFGTDKIRSHCVEPHL
ncbi:hypothetical protein RF11_13395 [Thelohanellus kitauei]|uniref:Uncharacterized protein n=1 Tax=Thelohanellus kitauei TaxID=669202 RepID=A0A0C2ITV2_THEKT|nr:hypothetical protein RF11_13395 [Thelohanellus kitauei]